MILERNFVAIISKFFRVRRLNLLSFIKTVQLAIKRDSERIYDRMRQTLQNVPLMMSATQFSFVGRCNLLNTFFFTIGRWLFPDPDIRLRPRLRFSDISNKILDSNISSCGSNDAAAAAAQNLSRRAGSGYSKNVQRDI